MSGIIKLIVSWLGALDERHVRLSTIYILANNNTKHTKNSLINIVSL